MTHGHHPGGLTMLAIVAAVAWVFGPRVAKAVVGAMLVVGGLFFAYVMFRIVTGDI